MLAAAYGAGAGLLALWFAGPHCVAEYLAAMDNVYRGFATEYRYFALGASSAGAAAAVSSDADPPSRKRRVR